ncbi:MAG: hypothetical protein ACR2MY_08920 [Candidatus Dormibacteria bacterium]
MGTVAGLGLSLMALAPMAAHADTPGVSDTIAFQGHAAATVLLVGGGGTFGFNSGTCALMSDVDSTTEPAGSEVDTHCSVTASGSFANIVCGTGTADGSASISSTDGSALISFHIVFAGGVGTITGSGTESDGGTGLVVAGTVQIAPDAGGSPPVCTNGFTVTTVATLSETA